MSIKDIDIFATADSLIDIRINYIKRSQILLETAICPNTNGSFEKCINGLIYKIGESDTCSSVHKEPVYSHDCIWCKERDILLKHKLKG